MHWSPVELLSCNGHLWSCFHAMITCGAAFMQWSPVELLSCNDHLWSCIHAMVTYGAAFMQCSPVELPLRSVLRRESPSDAGDSFLEPMAVTLGSAWHEHCLRPQGMTHRLLAAASAVRGVRLQPISATTPDLHLIRKPR